MDIRNKSITNHKDKIISATEEVLLTTGLLIPIIHCGGFHVPFKMEGMCFSNKMKSGGVTE